MTPRPRTIDQLPEVSVTPKFALSPGRILASGRREHGPIFRTVDYTGEKRLYVVGPEANRLVMVSDYSKFSNFEGWSRTDSVVETLGRGLIFMDGPDHHRLRLAVSPAFSATSVAAWVPTMSAIIAGRLSNWRNGSVIDLYEEAYSITFEIAAVLLIGLEGGQSVDRLLRLFHELMSLNVRALNNMDLTARSAGRRRREISIELGELLRTVIGSELQPGSTPLSSIAAAGYADGRPFSDDELVAHANTFLLAGHITTSSLCAFLLHRLATDEDNRDRILVEQHAVGIAPSEADYEVFERMPALECVVKEAERMFPPVPALPRGVVEDFIFEGYRIPIGETVHCSIAGSHMGEDMFSDPDKFDPSRFGPPRVEHLATPLSLVGFGAGPRRCIGQTMAKAEIKLIVTHVLSRFALEPISENEAVPFYHPVLTPLNGLRVRVWAL